MKIIFQAFPNTASTGESPVLMSISEMQNNTYK